MLRSNSNRTRVLIVDDSAVVRQTLRTVLESDPDIEVIGTASDPIFAAKHLEQDVPDVITLDLEMPRMDGLSFLKKLMATHPLPVVICSSQAAQGSANALQALELGAVEIITKPRLGTKQFFEESKTLICDTVKAAHRARVGAARPLARLEHTVAPKLNADVILRAPAQNERVLDTTEKVVVVGASTGGTEALKVFLQAMPENGAGVVVVQHMPEHFTAAFAQRLNGLCGMDVKEAAHDDTVMPGRVLIAPGNHHCLLKRSGARYFVEIADGPLVTRHRPSVDVLFRSAARYAGKNAVGVIMTGMGDDGARGMLELKQAGAATIAQDEATCVVFGMPNEAIKRGAVDRIVPLERIAGEVVKATR